MRTSLLRKPVEESQNLVKGTEPGNKLLETEVG